jgi:pantetheine-phosphate adenylyltransferase
MTKVIYAGSFDPVTEGHIGIINQAATIFDEVVVAIGINPGKKGMFSIDERKEMLRQSTVDIPNVSVDSFEGFLPSYALEIGAGVIVRGLRSAADFESEQGMRYVYDKINSLVQVVYLIAEKELSEVSSSLVKGLVGADPGWEKVVKVYVPDPVFLKLKSWYDEKMRREDMLERR